MVVRKKTGKKRGNPNWIGKYGKKSKYGVAPPEERTMDGIVFHSKKEKKRYSELKYMEQVDAIYGLKVQPVFKFTISVERPPRLDNYNKPILDKPFTYERKYIADFQYRENGKEVIEEVKGAWNTEARLKVRWFKALYPEYDFRII